MNVTTLPCPVEPTTAEEAERLSRFLDLAEFCGVQLVEGYEPLELWTLKKQVGRHPRGSTVPRQTLEKAIDQLIA